MERVLGTEHPETLIARGHLAVWTGHRHPDTLTDRSRLAYWQDEPDGDVSRDLK